MAEDIRTEIKNLTTKEKKALLGICEEQLFDCNSYIFDHCEDTVSSLREKGMVSITGRCVYPSDKVNKHTWEYIFGALKLAILGTLDEEAENDTVDDRKP